jgi:hypothetical protein
MSHGEDSLANQARTGLNWRPACGPQDFCKTKVLNFSHLYGWLFYWKKLQAKNFKEKDPRRKP